MEKNGRSGLGRWPVSIEVDVAWGDMDSMAHVNNTVFLRWFESSRVLYFERSGVVDRMKTDGIGPILARQEINYRLPLHYPDRVRIDTTVTGFGTSSFAMAFRITSAARGGAVVADGEGVVVMIDYRKGARVTVPDELHRSILELESEASDGEAGAVGDREK